MSEVNFLDKGKSLIKEDNREVIVFHVRETTTCKKGYMASLYVYKAVRHTSNVLETRHQAEEKGKEMFNEEKEERKRFWESLEPE